MKIVMFSINPLFGDRVLGGAPKQIKNISVYLGEMGHEVVILSTRCADSCVEFRWHDNVLVKPILRFHQPFPQPYAIPAYDIANMMQDVAAHLDGADRFYMHDGEFLFPYAYQHIPTVVALRDNVYPETILGGFLFQGDRLIAVSEYSRRFYAETMGRFLPELNGRLLVVSTGIDWDIFKPTPPQEILAIVPVDPVKDAIVIHPHRPEPSKGLPQTIAVADLLVHKYGITNLKVLVPRWLEVGISPEVAAFYREMETEIKTRNLTQNFIFHEWIPQSLMPQYYSLGAVTLGLGNFVESFGNSPYESLGCGTPAIVSRVSTHRELLPDHLIDKVHFGDAEIAAVIAAQIIIEKRKTSPETLAYLHENYGVQSQLEGYAQAILNAQCRDPLAYRYTPITEETNYCLPSWCYLWEGGIYHDFLAKHQTIPALQTLLSEYPEGFTQKEAIASGISPAQLETWYRDGYLIVK
ncbi:MULTISPECIES: glycosyltransferase family 4 protein [Cyanophyceae]|uniref:glycosyltransferase family 4 protein n=2 Tax=Cyanophyceae TaxID=3028117 RepID=UPI00016DC74B|nr:MULTISPECIES: glycosyltransferase family 4 protein [Cyanophyceae]ACA98163.1 glycosyl transferase, group 1 family protein [Picosynechococcus sp. PCC 7002]SMH43936.1 Glycosyltransferase involved in cell wall bisynthesis [Picosynechococcus sp. OG1]SMQ79650.1 Glycosyltransferase involved in cell wall bisynthesis [Synechococcus sp. 7002]